MTPPQPDPETWWSEGTKDETGDHYDGNSLFGHPFITAPPKR